jgi:hypothetical protein
VVGLAVFLGLPFTVLEVWGVGQDPGQLVILIPGMAFLAVVLAVPAFQARRLARALRTGRVAHATVTNVIVQPPEAYMPTIEAMRNGFAAGNLRLLEGGDEVKFESDAFWASRLRPGTPIEVLVDPRQNRILWILGPTDVDESVRSSDPGDSRTMPER